MKTNKDNVCKAIRQCLSHFKTQIAGVCIIITLIVAAIVIFTVKCNYQSSSGSLFHGCHHYGRGVTRLQLGKENMRKAYTFE